MSSVQGSSLTNFPVVMGTMLTKVLSATLLDYFNRPFSCAAEEISDLWNSGHQCIHARPEADIMLDYLKRYFAIAIKLKGRHILQ
jgi:hypothetical protein